MSVPHIAGDKGYPNLNVESTEDEKEKKTKQMERLKNELDKQVKAKWEKKKKDREESHRLDEIANQKAHYSLQEEEKRRQQKREKNKTFLRENYRLEDRIMNKRQQLLARENIDKTHTSSYRGLHQQSQRIRSAFKVPVAELSFDGKRDELKLREEASLLMSPVEEVLPIS